MTAHSTVVLGQPTQTRRRQAPWRAALNRFLANRMAVAGGVLVLLFIVLAAVGELLTPHDPLYQDLMRIAEGPSADFWLGTDELGRDFFSRILAGARTALIVAALVTFIAAGLGTVIGLVSAYLGGWVDGSLMRLADILLAFPTFLLAAFLNTTLRPPVASWLEGTSAATGIGLLANREVIDFIVVFGALAVVSWSSYARLIRGQVLSLREQEFVTAARSIGAATPAILWRQILPNSIAPVIVAVSVNFGNAILAESALSYLGVGIQPPTPSWGQMINANLDQWRYYPHLVLVPGAVLALLILGFNFFGDGVADALNPRQGKR
ncbi:MAG: ABC transporter permease [Chloroflexota bacterium]|nr:ABC transporter permease [Chloroflexota bacterium]